MVIDRFIISLQKDLSYDDMAIKEYKFSYEEKMIAKERKFSSTISTSNSEVTKKGVSSSYIYTISTAKVIVGGERNINVEMLFDFLNVGFFFLLNDTSMHLVSEYMRILYLVTVASRLFILIANGNQRQSNRFG